MAAQTLSTYDKAEQERKKTSDISFRFGEKDKVQPAGFENLSPDKTVTIILTGKVREFSSGDYYDKSKRLTLIPESIEIQGDKEGKIVSLDSALSSAASTRRKVK